MKTNKLKITAFLSQVFGKCQETGEKQTLEATCGIYQGFPNLTIFTKGKTTAWKHTILSEEIDRNNIPQADDPLEKAQKEIYKRFLISAKESVKRAKAAAMKTLTINDVKNQIGPLESY